MNFKPSALIVGAQKAGTTAMLRNICEHPEISGTVTEQHFFSTNWEKGEEWYLGQIRDALQNEAAAEGHFIIEKSPSYLFHPKATDRIFRFNPDMKIIICLRNPVDRAYSRYNDILVDEPDRITKTFAEFVQKGIEKAEELGSDKTSHYLKYGHYAPQVKRYFDTFGRDNVKVVIQERWKAHPYETIVDVVDFLGFQDMPVFEVKSVHVNPYGSEMDEDARRELKDYFSDWNEKLFDLLGERIPEWDLPGR